MANGATKSQPTLRRPALLGRPDARAGRRVPRVREEDTVVDMLCYSETLKPWPCAYFTRIAWSWSAAWEPVSFFWLTLLRMSPNCA